MDNELLSQVIDYGVKIVGVLIALWIASRIAAWIERRVKVTLEARNFDKALTLFFASLARWTLLISAVLACLGVFGIEPTSFAAILGAAGLAIGLAFQGTLSNFSAGVMLLTFRPFSIGDYVKTSGQEGVVAEIGLFVTAIDTVDNRRIIVPNSAVVSGTIENVTFHDARRVDINVGVAYDADLQAARKVLDTAAAAVEGRHPEKGHQIFLVKMNDSSVDFQVRIWCATADYWAVWDRTTLAVKQALDSAGISIPFPQMDLHVKELPSPTRIGA